MKIALCCINSKYVHSSLAPWYLAAAMEGIETCEVSVVEGTINQSVEEISQKILHNSLEVEMCIRDSCKRIHFHGNVSLPPVLLLDDLMVDALQQRRFQRMGRSQKMPVCSV